MKHSAFTRALLSGGIIAGPLYLVVGLVEAFTREGFEITKHSLSLLSNGYLGWIHIALFIVTGVLVIGASTGIKKCMQPGPARSWAPLLLSLYGVGLIGSGFFVADPSFGFPPGATAGPPDPVTLRGSMHFVAGAIGFIGLIAACFVFAARFKNAGLQTWKNFSLLTGIVFLLGFVGIATGSGSSLSILGFWMAVILSWIWLSTLSAHFRNRATPIKVTPTAGQC